MSYNGMLEIATTADASFMKTGNVKNMSTPGEKKIAFWNIAFQWPYVLFSPFLLRAKQAACRYVTTHTCIPAELRGSAVRSRRRQRDISPGVVLRHSKSNRHLEKPTTFCLLYCAPLLHVFASLYVPVPISPTVSYYDHLLRPLRSRTTFVGITTSGVSVCMYVCL